MTAIRLTHIGGPTTLIEVDGWRILTDPTFDPPGKRYRFGWGTSSRKIIGPAIPVAEVGPIDVVLLTHEHHADNLDDAGRALLPAAGAVVTTVSGAGRIGSNARGVRPWDTTRLESPGRPSLTVTATPCRHGPAGSRRIVGDVIGFAITWEGQEHGALWISGDTVFYDGLRVIADHIDVGTAIVHLGRVRFGLTGPISYTMGIDDALLLCRLLDPHTVIPVHYEGWTHFTQGRREIEARLAIIGDVDPAGDIAKRVVWAPTGESTTIGV